MRLGVATGMAVRACRGMRNHQRLLLEIAARNHNVVVRRDAIARGVSGSAFDRQIASGGLTRLHPGVYCLHGYDLTWLGRVFAAVVAAGSRAVASHRSAAALHQLDGFRTQLVELTVPRNGIRSVAGARVHSRRVAVTERDRTTVDGIPCTTIERTLVDCAWIAGLARAESALDGAERDRLIVPFEVHAAATRLRGRGRTRTGALADLTEARRGAQPTTKLERMLLRLVREYGLPEPECQFSIGADGATFIVDFAWPRHLVVVETDGRRGHAATADRTADNRRDDALTNAGWRVIRFTYDQVKHDPMGCMVRLRRALDRPGH